MCENTERAEFNVWCAGGAKIQVSLSFSGCYVPWPTIVFVRIVYYYIKHYH